MKAWQGAPLEPSFQALYERWLEDVTRWVRAMGAREADCDDLVQEVFLVVHRRLHEFDGRNAGAWLHQIARRKVRDHGRMLWVKRLFGSSDVPLARLGLASQRSPLDELETKHERELLTRSLNELSEDQRAAFVLFHIEGSSGEQIAELSGVKLNTVWARLFKARQRLRNELLRVSVRATAS
ncbi:MAG TPA: sigma-70 family RNA polymerase sigma factor [Polyangiaceae bacterium]|nr:sigma-70 family RNA polymerase sigma factor [Polyangiaceae bacterium]